MESFQRKQTRKIIPLKNENYFLIEYPFPSRVYHHASEPTSRSHLGVLRNINSLTAPRIACFASRVSYEALGVTGCPVANLRVSILFTDFIEDYCKQLLFNNRQQQRKLFRIILCPMKCSVFVQLIITIFRYASVISVASEILVGRLWSVSHPSGISTRSFTRKISLIDYFKCVFDSKVTVSVWANIDSAPFRLDVIACNLL